MTAPTTGPATGPADVPSRIEVWAPSGIGEITEGADLAEVVRRAVPDLTDGDVVLVTSKIVSKAEGRVVVGSRDDVLAGETVRRVATRGRTAIVQNHQGLVQAAAGIDASNVTSGHIVLLPRDPDASARALRESLGQSLGESLATHGPNVAVLVTDTAGRAWRHGQTDLAIGAAGMLPAADHAGLVDDYGNPLAVTAPALADELAGAADLVEGKLTGRPVAVVRGLGAAVLPRGEHGPGARALIRPLAGDMFALGTREAVVAALAGEEAEAFGAPADVEDLVAALLRLGCVVTSYDLEVVRVAPGPTAPAALLHAFGWTGSGSELRPVAAPPVAG